MVNFVIHLLCLFLLNFFLIGEIFQTRCRRSCIYFTISSGWCQKCYDAKHWKSSRPRRKTRKLDWQNRRIRGQCKFSHFHNSIMIVLLKKFQDRFCFYEQSLFLIKNHSDSVSLVKVRWVFPIKFNFRVLKMNYTCYSGGT